MTNPSPNSECQCRPFSEGIVNTMNCPIHTIDTTTINKDHPKIKELLTTTHNNLIQEVIEKLPTENDLESPLQQSWKLGGTDQASFKRGHNQAIDTVTSILEGMKT